MGEDSGGLGRRLAAIAVTLLAIAALVYSTLGGKWLTTGPGAGFGLRAFEVCTPLGCDRRDNADVIAELARTSPAQVRSGFVEAGWITSGASWAAAAALALALLPLLLGARAAGLVFVVRVAQLALVVALGGALVFTLRGPGGPGASGLAFSFYVFGAGATLGLSSALMLVKLHRAPAPE